ncbi:hypothetical protein [Methanococcus maripaludis]|uniref:Transmembrane protein n=1 Tax=Methanococcus maripaludis TaxID=39152 RepID=A0A8T4H538_METMI|nr:hypothetical protein [Methanococcus maripaludis]MBM7408767.1 hypothetical protein [Methanococcus maripaludis]MBP2219064.1 hypothetical protein [Methanococcus maripaludis]
MEKLENIFKKNKKQEQDENSLASIRQREFEMGEDCGSEDNNYNKICSYVLIMVAIVLFIIFIVIPLLKPYAKATGWF